MRFFKPAVLVAALAAVSPALGTALTPRALDVTTDVCVNVNLNVLIVKLDVCLCLSTYLDYIHSLNLGAVLEATVKLAVGPLFNTAPSSGHCTYPPHAVPDRVEGKPLACLPGNPCSYHCTDGYKKDAQGKCACPAPKYDCGNKCSDQPCPSGGYRKRDMQPLKSSCPPGYDLCGVYTDGWASRSAWECLNTSSNLESCGGCVTPVSGKRSSGRDCSSIKGVNSVNCEDSKCHVTSCRHGYMITAAGDDCVKVMI